VFEIKTKRARRRAVVLVVFGVVPALPSLLLLRTSETHGEAVRTSEQISYALILAAAALVYFHWRMARSTGAVETTRSSAWLTVALALTALNGLGQASLVRPVPEAWRHTWPFVSGLALLAVLIVVVVVSERADPPGDPAVVGLVGGGVLTATSTVTVHLLPVPPFATETGALLDVTLGLAILLLAWLMSRHHHLSAWARPRLVTVACLLALAASLSSLERPDTVLATVAVVANLSGAVLLCTTSQSMLRRALAAHDHELRELAARLERARAVVLDDRELLHEVSATVAGIAHASEMIRTAQRIERGQRDRLQEMCDAELARLMRMVLRGSPGADTAPATTGACLDDVVGHLVTSHRARGLQVEWEPCGLRVRSGADEFAEVVNVLLTNAARHGAHTVWLDAQCEGDHVVLTCSDDGPGVDPALRDRIFTTGERGPRSTGQGLGLSIARRHLASCGGDLELTTSPSHPGATFVAHIPGSESPDAHHAA
jgi:signal transduction histidine kinase